MKPYLAALEAIVNSDCCRKPLYMAPEKAVGLVDLNHTLLMDNIDKLTGYSEHAKVANNLYYVQITSQEKYKAVRFKISTKFNTTNCPVDKPFANF